MISSFILILDKTLTSFLLLKNNAIIETLSQDYLDTESSRSVARHHDEPQLPQLSVQVEVPGVLIAVADDHIVHTPKGGPKVSRCRE